MGNLWGRIGPVEQKNVLSRELIDVGSVLAAIPDRVIMVPKRTAGGGEGVKIV